MDPITFTITVTNPQDFDLLSVAIGEALTDAEIEGTIEQQPPTFELTRFFRSIGNDPNSHTLSVKDLMDENGDFEDSAWVYLRDIVEEGYYDDSDWPSGTLCYYLATDGVQSIVDACAAWWDENPGIVLDQNLEDPRTWKKAA